MLRLVTEESATGAHDVVQFWKAAGPELWFAKDDDFDHRFRTRFLALYEEAAAGGLDHWTTTATGSLSLILLLDQFPRNSFRGTPRMYATDAHARRIATLAAAWGQDLLVDRELRLFMYMPFGHSESMRDHDRGGELIEHLGPAFLERARKYTDIIQRFGRFPHRNSILGRETTSDEEEFLRDGGFSG